MCVCVCVCVFAVSSSGSVLSLAVSVFADVILSPALASSFLLFLMLFQMSAMWALKYTWAWQQAALTLPL